MSRDGKIIATINIGELELILESLDMGMDQDLPWKEAFEFRDLKLLFNREIEEGENPYIKKDLEFDNRKILIGDMSLNKLLAKSKDVTLHIEDSTGSIDIKSEKQTAEITNMKSDDLELIITNSTISRVVTKKLTGCDFGIRMIPPSSGLSCVQEAKILMEDVSLELIFENGFEEIEDIGGNIYFENLNVEGGNSSLVDQDIGEDLDIKESKTNWKEINMKANDFDFDLGDLSLNFGALEFSDGEIDQLNFKVKDYSRNFENLVGNLKKIVNQGLRLVE